MTKSITLKTPILQKILVAFNENGFKLTEMSLFGLLNQNSGQYVMRDSALAGSDETNDVTSLSVTNQ